MWLLWCIHTFEGNYNNCLSRRAGDKVARRATTESEEINKGVIFNN